MSTGEMQEKRREKSMSAGEMQEKRREKNTGIDERWKTAEEIMRAVPRKAPLIHCITNPISIHDCANVILAAGARPIMAEHPEEVREITASADALGLNLGNLTDARRTSILLSGEEAARRNIPTILDLVGIGCSSLRRSLVKEFLEMRETCMAESRNTAPLILKGNLSEILVLSGMEQGTRLSVSGVDARPQDVVNDQTRDGIAKELQRLAVRHRAVLMATGATDVISDGETTYLIENGSKRMASVTGTGCMVTALTAAWISEGMLLPGALLGAVMFGVCGELAAGDWRGSGTYQVRLMDELSLCTWETIEKYRRVSVWNE